MRAWYRGGRPELAARSARGGLREVQACPESGSPLPEAEARALAAREIAADEGLYGALDALVQDHRPRCD
jgi:hypothetical protein